MKSADLTSQQLTTIYWSVINQIQYFEKLLARCKASHFPDNDPLVLQTGMLVRELWMMRSILSRINVEVMEAEKKKSAATKWAHGREDTANGAGDASDPPY